MIKKIYNRLKLLFKTDVLKTLYWNYKCAVSKRMHFFIYANSIIQIADSAKLDIKKGTLEVNKSHFGIKRKDYCGELRLDEHAHLLVGNNFSLYQGASIYVAQNARLVLKGNGFINTQSQIECYNYIEIGANTIISDNVRIQDSDIHYIKNEGGCKKNNTAPILIGDHVWIGLNVIILKGVTIGDGSVIGAGSVVTKNIPANSLVVGNPAVVIKRNISWE